MQERSETLHVSIRVVSQNLNMLVNTVDDSDDDSYNDSNDD